MSLMAVEGNLKVRHLKSHLMLSLCAGGALVAIASLGLVLFFLSKNGLPYLKPQLFTKMPDNLDVAKGGIAHSITGTLSLLGLASLLSIPLGVMGGIYQVEGKGKFAFLVRFLTDVLGGIPSIVIGIFVYALWVYPVSQAHPGQGFSGYAGGFALGIMMIPLVMRVTEEMLRLVPQALYEAALALGAPRWKTMLGVVLPAARAGIITGIMLALARVAGETAPLLFTILGNEFRGPLDGPIDALPLRLYRYATNADVEQNKIAWATALVLILMILCLSIVARLATRSRMQEDK